ncbi:hypothetical protein BN2476_630102 [Paraburkholderia piptadeniae]|uniref:Uncharacterized protein n=1 Tax=Paraburkholderia piptadeniae TaxID=1701573 RepID=A0A1N7SLU2_9BURK|nr:hypothetical protein BN2476_630102 [Paraburkholderia piptadeniae]
MDSRHPGCRRENIVVVTDAWREFSRTVVNVAPRASAWVACVCLIQCGVARPQFVGEHR